MATFGLIGRTLKHSFSKKYFTNKFIELGLDLDYDLFELKTIAQLKTLLKENTELKGLNVTIPYKIEVLPFINSLDISAQKVGAVNVIKVLKNGDLRGYNSDYYGFKTSVEKLLNYKTKNIEALILGNGGATRAVKAALKDLHIDFKVVSRRKSSETISYSDSYDLIQSHQLIINTSPLGTYPDVSTYPNINYEKLSEDHFLFDLVYNPEESQFLNKGRRKGAKGTNGYEMLVLQAEKSWEIWNS